MGLLYLSCARCPGLPARDDFCTGCTRRSANREPASTARRGTAAIVVCTVWGCFIARGRPMAMLFRISGSACLSAACPWDSCAFELANGQTCPPWAACAPPEALRLAVHGFRGGHALRGGDSRGCRASSPTVHDQRYTCFVASPLPLAPQRHSLGLSRPAHSAM